MRYLVAYDICEARRLRQTAKVCEDYGVRVQKSVFECDLEPVQFESLWEELQAVIDEEDDYLVAYPLCQACSGKVLSAGVMVRPEKVVAYIC